jgi:4-carboxymuconolactone decarboxylase
MANDRTDEFLSRLADNNPELIERLVGRQIENIEESGLDPRTHALVRIASLVAVGAPSASFAWQVALAREAGASDDEIAGVLLAVAPTVGLPLVVAASPHVAAALSS